MTSLPPQTAPRKRRPLFMLLALFVMAAAWITYFLVNFDLNDYRQKAEEELSALLSLPVQIGDIHYNFHDTNLALHVNNLRIGDKVSTIQVETGSVMINLKWMGLLERDFRVSKISLNRPEIRIRVPRGEMSAGTGTREKISALDIDPILLSAVSVNSLEVTEGSLSIERSAGDEHTQKIAVTGLEGSLSEIGINRPMQLIMRGDLQLPGQAQSSVCQLLGQSSLIQKGEEEPALLLNLDLAAKTLDLGALQGLLPEPQIRSVISGKSDLQLHIEGSPGQGLDFQITLSSDKIALRPYAATGKPINFQRLLASGRLETQGEHPGISNLALELDETRLTGSIAWPPPDHGLPIKVTIDNSSLATVKIKSWLPEESEPWLTLGQKLLDQGSVRLMRAEISLSKDENDRLQLGIDRLQGELLQMAWAFNQNSVAVLTSIPFELTGNEWLIRDGQGHWNDLPWAVEGAGFYNYNNEGLVVTSLDLSSELAISALADDWLETHLSPLTVAGRVPITGHLEGTLKQLSLDLKGDLSQLQIDHPDGLQLRAEATDSLTLLAAISPQTIRLDHGAFKWAGVKGHLAGQYSFEDPDSLIANALLTIDDLGVAAKTLPFLERLQPSGQADLSYRQKGSAQKNPPEVVLTLRDAGLRPTSYIADLNQINGRVQVTPTGLYADNLSVHLGQSLLTVKARLEDWSSPRLTIDTKAPSIRANDLIFHSDQAWLREVDGHLEIDGDGLTFAPVLVRLDGGTTATVRGSIAFHPPFDVKLDITSEFARIGEVIALWGDSGKTTEQESVVSKEDSGQTAPRSTVTINAQVKNGDLYGMSFHNAAGVISPSHQRLIIHPLDFSVGEGFCNAQVITDYSAGEHTRLLISGHAEDVDALEVYRELLNQKNIVRGKLRGDFYLSGEIGSGFLASSNGQFSIQIGDGVLHQFPILSKVFSLLNVSQIFALQLPDMDREGMPFDTLAGNLTMEQGILKSEDLKIHSESMNQAYSGQINLDNKEIDLTMAIHPLGTVDKIVSRIPLAGWLLTGDNKALLTANFSVKGKADNVVVSVLPLDSLSEPTIGLLRRTLELPFKLIEDPQILWGGDGSKK